LAYISEPQKWPDYLFLKPLVPEGTAKVRGISNKTKKCFFFFQQPQNLNAPAGSTLPRGAAAKIETFSPDSKTPLIFYNKKIVNHCKIGE